MFLPVKPCPLDTFRQFRVFPSKVNPIAFFNQLSNLSEQSQRSISEGADGAKKQVATYNREISRGSQTLMSIYIDYLYEIIQM